MTVPKFASQAWHDKAKKAANDLRNLAAEMTIAHSGWNPMKDAADLLDPPPDPETELNDAIANFASGILSRESHGMNVGWELLNREIDERAEAIRGAARKMAEMKA